MLFGCDGMVVDMSTSVRDVISSMPSKLGYSTFIECL
jgi:hypothetical protein